VQQPIVATRGEDLSAEYVALEAKRNAFGELKKLLVSRGDAHAAGRRGRDAKAELCASGFRST